MSVKRFTLINGGRRLAHAAIDAAPDGMVCEIREASKSREQEARYHAMIGDIARQWKFCDRFWAAEDMKRLLLDQFLRDTIRDPDFAGLWKSMGAMISNMAPSIDGMGVVALGVQSRRMPKKLATAFIEFLFAFGAEREIHWSDPTIVPVESYVGEAGRHK